MFTKESSIEFLNSLKIGDNVAVVLDRRNHNRVMLTRNFVSNITDTKVELKSGLKFSKKTGKTTKKIKFCGILFLDNPSHYTLYTSLE